ncbi:exopolysaccharide polymerization protein [Sphingopyxis fribergensis]|uniref:Exopolysaccharide polymerization protein n=1 Tax=Sphingopyxis fribergensis TaxID=1515612 RepID=A0A0A7PJA5_9SPHN|nr:polysaccharide pyruvyl transferase family protein [Sphingopyxis fribergensis]AJA10080.1 exopolysaccharide polymerization protein [Sphingopyxis fribergensis]
MTQKTADQLVGELAQRFVRVLDAVLPAGPLALVDFPDHSNVGDSAIWLGEMAYLRKRSRLPSYYSAIADFEDGACRAAIGGGAILIHGGGNMGTLWPKHEAFRLHLLRTHRGRPIIQMPQSIHYADPAAAAEMAEAIREHGQFTLLVRDARSLAFAEQHFDCAIHLCPDAALMLGRQQRSAATVPVFALLRTDHERAAGEANALPAGVVADDWLEEDAGQKRRLRLSLKLGRLFNRDPMAQRAARQQRLAEWRFQRGLVMLSAGELVVTDRLHAHILSLLLDIPHVLLDNSYGKVAGFADQWTGDYAGLMRATHRAEAFETALACRAPLIVDG